MSSHSLRYVGVWRSTFVVSVVAVALLLQAGSARAAESAACLSSNPSDWPLPSAPYFMIVVDTSGSMSGAVATANSCGYPNTRIGHAACAVYQTLEAYAGEVNFGLATFSVYATDCNAGCTTCNYWCYQDEIDTRGICWGCGPRPGNYTTASGARIVVPMLQDHFWSNPPDPSNLLSLLSWVDNSCAGDDEVFAMGNTPLNGALQDMRRYFASSWTEPDGGVTYTTPLSSSDLAGVGANGGTACRSVNVILLTDGDETCDTQADAVNAATSLYSTGVTVGGKTFKIPVHVINFIGGSVANTDAIAAAGGTGASLFATNETQLAQALANIVTSAIQPETCDNLDNNCNGCTDEGYRHFCNVSQTCCAWTTTVQRNTCLTNYRASITAGDPDGNLSLLPCTTVAQQTDPTRWLCYNPGDTCDNTVDNNCDGAIDEGSTKCGNPTHCPVAETCNGQDDDCDGNIDNGGVCGTCISSPEVCNGCDDDCDGVADDGIAGSIPCGLPSPPNCVGTMTCRTAAVSPGQCSSSAGYGACSYVPQVEVCDGVDNDCDGVVDDNVASVSCVPSTHPAGLVYDGTSQCRRGNTVCTNGSTVCVGGVGPSTEVCDGVDNDCDGIVDTDGIDVNLPCGLSTPPCTPGHTVCSAGTIVCQGGDQGSPEVCDGVDNDCDGQIDEAPLGDAPAVGHYGCWISPGAACSHQNVQWSPPPGATCDGLGSLSAPCSVGYLSCEGAAGWACNDPLPPSIEVCDGDDNDCDGLVDEDGSGNTQSRTCYSPGFGPETGCTDPTSCTGACQPGIQTCGEVQPGDWGNCEGEVTPTAEVCDGVDNDCDGLTDEPEDLTWIGQPCPISLGVCNGVWQCTAGVKECTGTQAQPGRCDGLDNNCDGLIDDAAELAEDPLNGQPCGVDEGTCQTGVNVCVNGAWQCAGAVGPIQEVCDGTDNNCDGLVDNEAECPPVGERETYCVEGDCRTPCDPANEFPCSPGLECVVRTVDGTDLHLCMPEASELCGTELCPEGWVCDVDHCVNPCDPNLCDWWETCNRGLCLDRTCSGQGMHCPAGSACVNHQCVEDPCLALGCEPQAEYCQRSCDDQGVCTATCEAVCACGPDQVCTAPGVCAPDPCADTTCGAGTRCDPETRECEADPCSTVACGSGERCFEGDCITDPCTLVSCPLHFGCVVHVGESSTGDATPVAYCEAGAAFWVPGREGEDLTAGGSGCSCRTGAGAGAGPPIVPILAVGLFVLWRRRRAGGAR